MALPVQFNVTVVPSGSTAFKVAVQSTAPVPSGSRSSDEVHALADGPNSVASFVSAMGLLLAPFDGGL